MRPLEDALAHLARHLAERQIPYMVIGGIANLVWGTPRTTMDIDATVDAPDEQILEIGRTLGELLPQDPAAFLAERRVLPVRLVDGTVVDIVAAGLPYESEAIARARPFEFAGVTVAMCAPEDLIIHKILAGRPQDLLDVAGVLRRTSVDLGFLDRWIAGMSSDLADDEIASRWADVKADAGIA